jgi:predicted lipoprotein with Yx(FWY)xxD motif
MAIRDIQHFILVLGLTGAACGSDANNSADAPSSDGAAAAITLSTAGSVGAHLVDSQGKTLYFYANDVAGSNATACTGACLTTWPAFDANAPTVGSGLTAMDFGRFDRGGGTFQATWKGRPLYYFSNDTATAPTAGEGTGGRWFVARAYNLFVAANATVTPQGGAAANAPFLTNGAGRSVYVFQNDTRGAAGGAPTSACAAPPCSTNWPLWEKPATLTDVVLPSTIQAADVTAFTNGGKQQFVFKGWPLYFYGADDVPGKVAGAGVASWRAVSGSWNGAF